MCPPNKTKKGNKAFSYLFRTSLAITISAMLSGRLGAISRMEVFPSSNMNCISMDGNTEVFYHLNKILIATKHIADNNFVFSKTAYWHILYATVQTSQLHFF